MQKNSWKIHTIFLFSVFLLGNTIIAFPKGQGVEYAIYALAAAIIPTIYLILILERIDITREGYIKAFIAFFSFLTLIVCAKDYIDFVNVIRLPKTPRLIISAVFIPVICFMALLKKRVVYLFSVFTFLATALIFIFVFIFSANKLNFKFLIPSDFRLSVFVRQSFTFFVHSFGQLIIPYYFIKSHKQQNKVFCRWGVAAGFALILIYILNILLVLGGNVSKIVEYPYTTLTSIVSFGENFSRLDGFTYYVYFYSNLIKGSVCSIIIINYFSNKKIAAVLLAAALILVVNINNISIVLNSDIFNFILLLFELIFPLIVLVVQKLNIVKNN